MHTKKAQEKHNKYKDVDAQTTAPETVHLPSVNKRTRIKMSALWEPLFICFYYFYSEFFK